MSVIDDLWTKYLAADSEQRKALFASVARVYGKGFAKRTQEQFEAAEAEQSMKAQLNT